MRDSFVLTFLLVLLIVLAYLVQQLYGVRQQIMHVQHDVAASPRTLDFHDRAVIKSIAAGKILVPPPPPYTVPQSEAQ